MQVIGASVLTDYAQRHPRARPALQALLALLRAAEGRGVPQLQRDFPALIRAGPGGKVALELPDLGLRVSLSVNDELGLVRIVSVDAQDRPGKQAP